MADWLIIGLGNPGAQYAGSRHNCGAESIDLLARRHSSQLKAGLRNDKAQIADVTIGGVKVALAVPMTFYNDSGLAVAALARRHGIEDMGRIVVIHDELDLEPGRVKVKVGGGLAGNNGLRSIDAHLHSSDFVRVRIGIGKPPGRQQGVDHVLRKPGKADRELLDIALQVAADAVELMIAQGIDEAMKITNARG